MSGSGELIASYSTPISLVAEDVGLGIIENLKQFGSKPPTLASLNSCSCLTTKSHSATDLDPQRPVEIEGARAGGLNLSSLFPMTNTLSEGSSGDGVFSLVGSKDHARDRRSKNREGMDEKRLRRLEKNRESARECRRRKKEHKELLEAELEKLEAENLALRLKLNLGDEAEEAENDEIDQIHQDLDHMVSNGVEDGRILQKMDVLQERHADYGK
ncbi:unnamed protein product [Discosporangium mesarthrocarpum]